MLDKTYVSLGGGSSHHYNTTEITERRAPTDESVRLLQEMEEKAKERISDKFTISNSQIDAVAIVFYDEIMENKRNVHIRFKLNGESHLVKTGYRKFDMELSHGENYRQEVFRVMREAVAEQIATKVLKSGLSHELIRAI